MERLAQIYWYPLYAFARRQGLREADAEDAVQGFLTRFVSGSHIHGVDSSNGRFRSFLLKCFKNYLADDREKAASQKRGGGIEFVPLDALAANERYRSESGGHGLNREERYDLDWAQSLVAEVLERLRRECKQSGKEDRFEVLIPFLIEDPTPEEVTLLRKNLALGESGVRTALRRLRLRFGEFLWTEIARTLSDVSQVEQETRYVLGILSKTDPMQGS